MVWLEVAIVAQYGPTDARHLVGIRHRGLVDADPGDQSPDPATERILLVADATDHGPGAMHQQATQGAIPAFTDAQQHDLATGAVLPLSYRQSRPLGKPADP